MKMKNIRHMGQVGIRLSQVVLGAMVGLLLSFGVNVGADVTDNVSGYAWSETIGWVAMNGAWPNAVNVDVTGNITGYAWSSNIGWVSFQPGDVAACGAQARIEATGAITGWARALAPVANLANAGGWDGCISLAGAGYGVTVLGCDWSGWAWGSTVVGWLNFGGWGGEVTASGDACRFANLRAYGSYTLSPGVDVATGIYDHIDIAYTIENEGGTAAEASDMEIWHDGTLQTTVNTPMLAVLATDSGFYRINNISYGPIQIIVRADADNDVNESNESDNDAVINDMIMPPDPNLRLSVDDIIRSGTPAVVSWDMDGGYPMDCELRGLGLAAPYIFKVTDAAGNPVNKSGSVTTDPISNKGTYILKCTEVEKGTFAEFSTTAEVEVTTSVHEI